MAKSQALLKSEMQARMRMRIEGEQLIDRVCQARQWLAAGYAPVVDTPTPGNPHPVPNRFEPLTRLRTEQLKIVAGLDLALLNKVLPDERSIQVEDVTPIERKPMSELDLATRFAHVLNSSGGASAFATLLEQTKTPALLQHSPAVQDQDQGQGQGQDQGTPADRPVWW